VDAAPSQHSSQTEENEMEQSVEKIIERNLLEVFNARDAGSRRAAIDELWDKDGVFIDPGGVHEGAAKINAIVQLVTPALLRRLQGESIADKELSVLLARDQLVPIVHGTTYEALREVSPLLGSRTGLSTTENPMADVAAKLAELVAIQ
jgi:hypothetical protein